MKKRLLFPFSAMVVLAGCSNVAYDVPGVRYVVEVWPNIPADCADQPFNLGAKQLDQVRTAARHAAVQFHGDRLSSVLAKCVQGNSEAYVVCGILSKHSDIGHIVDARKFYGIYHLNAGHGRAFEVKALGPEAENICVGLDL